MAQPLTDPAKLMLLTSLLSDDRIISNNGKTYLKEMILRRDPRLAPLLNKFEEKDDGDNTFVEQIQDLIMTEASSVYDELFEDTSLEVGKSLSKDEREKKQLGKEKSLIYGEVEFNSFYRVLRKLNPEPGLIFYDLGSGTGKAVFVARFTQDFSKCIGIEILEGLHNQASVIVQRYNESFKDNLYHGQPNYAACYEGSFLDYDWSDGDVIFANSTCFDDDLMDSLSQEAENLKPGAMVVTFTKGMTSDKFETLERKRYKMSWGPATVFIHRRLNEDGTPVGPPRLNILPSDNINYDEDDNAAYNKAYGGAGRSSNTNDDDDDDDEDDDEEEDEDEEDDIDEEERDEEEEEEGEEEKDGEDDEEEEEEDDDDEDDFDIDEYIKKITSEMKRKNYLSKTVDSEEDQDDYEDDDEEEEGDADDEDASGGEEEDESPDEEAEEVEEGEEQDEEDDDEDDDEDDSGEGDEGSEDLNAVAAEMEEQIRQITERINYNKSLISSYTEKLNSPSRAAAGGGAGSIESSSGSNSPAGMSGYSKESTSPASFQAKKSPPRSTPTKASPNTQPIAVSSNGNGKSPVKSTDHLSIQSPSTRDYNAEFLAMTSPQDSALQARKRLAQTGARKMHQPPSFDDLSELN